MILIIGIYVLQVRHSQRANEPLLSPWIKTDKDGAVLCGHCDCMAGLGEVCSHVGALLFYVEAMRCSQSCTETSCSWNVPPSIQNIQYAKIVDIDFTVPKPIIKPVRRGAHVHNDCQRIEDPQQIEVPVSMSSHCTTEKSTAINPNKTEPTEDQKSLFYNRIAKYKPSFLSLVSPFLD